jgi:uncharacterized membrane protein
VAVLTTYNVLKTLHVLAAVTWVGGALAFNILATRLRRANDSRALAGVAREMAVVGNAIFLPASLVVLALGVWMVVISGWDFEDLWIAIGIAGVVATAITGSVVIGPRLKKIGEAIAQRGPEDEGVQNDIARLFVIARIDLVVLAVVIVDMVIKPGT